MKLRTNLLRVAVAVLASLGAGALAQGAAPAAAPTAPPVAAPAAAPPAAGAPSADDLVRTVEKIMFPDEKAVVKLHFKSESRNEDYEMTCYTRDRNQKIIVRMTAPAAQVGNDILMIDQNVWTYDKRANRVIKVASNQSFGGTGFSYGDVVRINYSDNYSAALKSETADGYVLELTAKDRNAPYYRIELTITKQGLPVKGIHYARNGSVVKEITYSEVKDLGTGKKPVMLTVKSPLDAGAINVMTVTLEASKSLPDRIFNKRNLETRMEENL